LRGVWRLTGKAHRLKACATGGNDAVQSATRNCSGGPGYCWGCGRGRSGGGRRTGVADGLQPDVCGGAADDPSGIEVGDKPGDVRGHHRAPGTGLGDPEGSERGATLADPGAELPERPGVAGAAALAERGEDD